MRVRFPLPAPDSIPRISASAFQCKGSRNAAWFSTRTRPRHACGTRRAEALGFSYRTSSELASGPLIELVRRVLAIASAGTSAEAEAAVLGREDRPKDGWWKAYEVYKNVIKKDELAKKSPGQLTRWDNTRKGAISNFLSLVGGDKPIAETTREDGLTLHEYWLGRVVPDDKKQKGRSRQQADRHTAEHLLEVLQAPAGGQEEPILRPQLQERGAGGRECRLRQSGSGTRF